MPLLANRPPGAAESEILVLTVCDDDATFEAIEQLLVRDYRLAIQLRRVRDASMATARIAGGGIATILIDCSPADDLAAWLRRFPKTHLDFGGLPIVLWLGKGGPLPEECRRASAGWNTISTETPVAEILQLWTEHRIAELTAAAVMPMRPKSTVISVMGVKGGVGATTVAMNIAASLGRKGGVILGELRSTLGSLEGHFQPGRLTRGIAAMADHNAALPSLLWQAPRPAGLRVLFGPQKVKECREWGAAEVTSLLHQLAGHAGYLVLDLTLSLGEMNQAILAASHYLALVLEPTSAGVRLGRLMLEGIEGWRQTPGSVGAVMVKRRPEGAYLTAREVLDELGAPVLKVIPPAPEACFASEQARVPLVEHDREDLAADCLIELSSCFQQNHRADRAVPPPSTPRFNVDHIRQN